MLRTVAQFSVVGSGDPPRTAASSYKPGEHSGSGRVRSVFDSAIADRRPFEVNNAEITVQPAQAMPHIRPAAIPHIPLMDLGVPVREFLRTLQPAPSDGDKIDIRFDKFRQGRRIMSVPGILPTG
jgi:hypothetical protein